MQQLMCCPVTTCANGILPVYQTSGSACADVAVPDAVEIKPHTTVKVDLKIKFNCLPGTYVRMYPRSSLLLKHGLILPVSIIDQDYHDHVHVVLHNLTDEVQKLDAGERVAQIECVPLYDCVTWVHIQQTRNGGFGSTGKS